MTEKLYYLDSHMWEFSARVLDCRETKSGFGIILDRTAFFPEGGSQLADTGTIGDVFVKDVHEKDGEILHYTDSPLAPGLELPCRIDREQRLRRMQNHSGEHIVSGLVNRKYGFDNVGFHMGSSFMTIDFSGELSWDELTEIEYEANLTVRQNVPIRTWFPDETELKTLSYRSKLELTENVRIVEVEGVDRCACCAPHVSLTGEVGVIKILDCMRHRGGVRISLVCGMDALDDYRKRQTGVTAVSQALSAKRDDIAAAVQRVLNEQQALREKCSALSLAYIRLLADAQAATDGNICLFEDGIDEIAQRELVNLLCEKCGGIAAVFCGSDAEGWRYILGSRHTDLRKAAKTINAAISGRGGGSPQMIQGRASESADNIYSFLMPFGC